MKKLMITVIGIFAAMIFSSTALADSACNKNNVVDAVSEAVAILEKEGTAGLGKVGKIRFCDGNYVFVNDFSGKTLMHINTIIAAVNTP